MAVKIRLSRRGRKKLALYDVVIAKSTSPRDGRFIDKIGTYNPNTNPASIVLDDDKAFKWLMNGAQPSDTVKAMLSYRGILFKKHLQIGVLKGAITQEQADERFNAWKSQKDNKITQKIDSLTKKKDDTKKAQLAAESKVKEAKAEAIRKKNTPVEAKVEEVEAPEATVENTEATPENPTE